MSRTLLRSVPLIMAALLTGCAVAPSQIRRKPSANVIAPPLAIAAVSLPSLPPAAVSPSVPADVWDTLRSSFAMDDCEADPAVLAWARRYTRNPQQFESKLQEVLPRLAYVQQIAASHGVPGEFALLPWIESQFRPLPGRRNRPAGMWQIMPVTAGTMGLRVDNRYDGRLDVPAAANAVMKMLRQYYDEFHDWRMADYAYNAGEFTVKKLVRQHGLPPARPAIPGWTVNRVTREHLTKLLAMACVVRQPDRFDVSLPVLTREQQLVQVSLPQSMAIARAADHAGMSIESLKDINAGFRGDTFDTGAASYLLLPVGHAQQFRDALLNETGSPSAHMNLPLVTTHGNTSPTGKHAHDTSGRTHSVRSGESLWQIAHHYSVSVSQLQRWNRLHGKALKPGQVLRINGD